MLSKFRKRSIVNEQVKTFHLHKFKEDCLYAGKGINQRMFSHAINGKKIKHNIILTEVDAKYREIIKTWENGEGLAVIRLFAEINHYEALSRENALIKALGLKNLTNKINGTCYGVMRKGWNETEIINFGNMLLFNTLKMAVQDPSQVIMEADIVLSK